MKINIPSITYEESFEEKRQHVIYKELRADMKDELFCRARVDYFCLYLVIASGGEHLIDGNQYPVKAGQLHLVYPGQVHEMSLVAKGRVEAIFIHRAFFTKLAVHFKFSYSIYLKCPVIKLDKDVFDNLAGNFRLIESELSQPVVNMKIVKLHLILSSEIIRREIARFLRVTNYTENVLLNSFLDLIEENFRKEKQVAFYAKKLNVTVSHLNLYSKRFVDSTASQLIFNRILEEANILLEQKNFSVKEISFSLGFVDASYFSRFFKNHTGLSPSQFKRMCP